MVAEAGPKPSFDGQTFYGECIMACFALAVGKYPHFPCEDSELEGQHVACTKIQNMGQCAGEV